MSFGVRALGILAILAATALPARAQVPSGFPAKPIRFVVPFPGGGINDVLARIAADKLTAQWGQPIVVENKTGAGGNIGADFAAQAEGDGHTLFITPPGPLAINQSLYRQLSYRPDDFVPITVLAAVPDKITYGSQGNGSTPHLTGSMFMTLTGVRMVHVPYRGENLVINDMLGGHVDVFFGNIAPALPHYRDGKLKVLAVADVKRAASIPDVPTAAEAGLPGFISTSWFAVAGPPKMPPALAQRIAADFADVLNLPDVQTKYRSLGAEPVGTTPAETAVFVASETARWREVIAKNNIRIE